MSGRSKSLEGAGVLDDSATADTRPPPDDEQRSRSRHIALSRVSGLQLRLDTPKGRGVFATQRIASGTVVDICPVLILSQTDNELVSQTALYHYSYNWPVQQPDGRIVQHQAIIFGLGSMFNHSTRDQNVVWRRDLEAQTVVYTALRDIQAGEELCISYGSNLWFEDADETTDVPESETDLLESIEIGG
ncbi:uncharacterized protein PV09_03679 [Verruconis gallopava]|uniref:SET domain-containing protein n=1 Tax=Verruconis gallopava TaxID=253628 RepID=A0A0D2AF70_9PEZI|nr:uncharacterized protein PV09_03679 [Verruconis gallopava]KIW05125.1 hypothetical protein PV09_03679 [Verruconis gallopava]